MSGFSRRSFLKSQAAATVLTFGGIAPGFLQAAARQARAEGRILVVVELAGGNDGLNTVVPFRDDGYRRARTSLALPESSVLKVDDELGLHPSLRGFAGLLEAGQLAIIQGVGYPEPNRSHFESMDIWHTCLRKDQNRTDGWLGRCFELMHDRSGNDPAGMHLGDGQQPFALMSRTMPVPSIQSLEQFRLEGTGDQGFRRTVRELADARRDAGNDLLDFVQAGTSSAIAASARIEAASGSYEATVEYPETSLASRLKTVARLIDAGLQTTVYYVRLDGFDTHSQQAEAHAALLRQLGDAVSAFVQDLNGHGHGERTLLMCFSEFGRRVQENASEGTDHGTAAPMFLIGRDVRAGLIGKHPGLTDLEDGDLKFHTDFRQVYATVLERWLKCDSQVVLRGQFTPVDALPFPA